MHIAYESVKSFLARSGLDPKHYVITLDTDNVLELIVFASTGGWNVTMRPPREFRYKEDPPIHFPASLKHNGEVTQLAKQVIDLLDRFMPEDRYREV